MRKELVVYAVYLYVLNKFAEVSKVDWDSALVDSIVNKIIDQAEDSWDVCEEVYTFGYGGATIQDVDRKLHEMHVKDPSLRAEALQLLGSIGAFEGMHEFESEDYINMFGDSESAKEVVDAVNKKLAEDGYEFFIKYEFIYAYDHILRGYGDVDNYYNFRLYLINEKIDPKTAEKIVIKYIEEVI